MKYALTILLFFASFFAQAEDSIKRGGFFSIDFGVAVDHKLTKFHYPIMISYGGNILDDQYIGTVEVGVGVYQIPFQLLFKYNYDFMPSSPTWSFGVDTALYLGGETIKYAFKKDGTITKDVYASSVRDEDGRKGINLYAGNDLGLFVKSNISKSFAIIFRGGVNNALAFRSREKNKNDKSIKITREFLNPNVYLSTGIEWYL